jgi:hypothetical protein
MEKKHLPFCLFLFILSFSLFAEADSDGVKLSMDILGWSREGLFAWDETVIREGREESLTKITDLVTDELIYSNSLSGKEKQSLLEQYAITSEKGSSGKGSRLVYQGTLYDIELFNESDRVNIRLKNINGGSYKEVNTAPLGGDSMEIKGSVISPYEKRAALVFLRRGEGRAEYVVMGAHLTIGFRAVPLEQEPLIEAVLNGQYYISRLILEKGTSPDSVTDGRGYTPLLLAARRGNWAMVQLLLDYDAQTGIKDKDGLSPADYARRAGENKLAEQLK